MNGAAAAAETTVFFPLSPAQRRLWILNQIDGDDAAYNVSAGIRIAGPLDVVALRVALAILTSRHETLRTAIRTDDAEPVQAVSPTLAPDFTLIDMAGRQLFDAAAGKPPAGPSPEQIVAEHARQPFDLSVPPLWRSILVRRDAEDATLAVTMHHAITDNQSMEIFFDELSDIYGDVVAGRSPSLTPPSLQYGDFAAWQQQPAETLPAHLDYWRRTLAGAPSLSSLPTDRPRPAQQSANGAALTREVPPRLMQRIQQVAHGAEATPAMVVLAALQISLHRAANQRDILIGMPVGRRVLPELERLIGLFVNMVVVRTDLEPRLSFIEVLRRTRDSVIEALEHQDAPFESVVDAVNPVRSLAHTPLFQVSFAQIKAAVGSRSFGTGRAFPYLLETQTSRFDLAVNLIEDRAERWWLQFEYNTDLYERARIEHFASQMIALLEAAGSDPSVPASIATSAPRTEAPRRLQRPAPFRRSNRWLPGVKPDHYVAPRDDVEARLAEIWCEVLGVRDIGVFDEFFDLGGNSLAAIRIVSQVRKRLGATIPVSTLFTDPTIAFMATMLRGEARGERSIVHLYGSGRRPPLFAAGSNHRYLELGKALGADQPFYKMDIYRLNELRIAAGQPPYDSVEAMAAAFIADILTVQPTGPFYIAGQCEGGIVAIDIARQMRGMGHEIGLLLQFDTPVRGYFRKQSWLRRALISLARGEVTQKLTDAVRRRHRGRVPPELEEQQHLALRDTIWSTIYAYRYDAPYDGKVTLLRATETYGIYDDVATGWDKVARELEVHDVPGDHIRFFGHSDSQKIIAEILRRAQAAHG